jgi:hypothetical protein
MVQAGEDACNWPHERHSPSKAQGLFAIPLNPLFEILRPKAHSSAESDHRKPLLPNPHANGVFTDVEELGGLFRF